MNSWNFLLNSAELYKIRAVFFIVFLLFQMYYLGPKNSPVYSLTFDTSRLYAALDLSITMADFSILPP